jgi:hypothetical protein
MRAYFRAKLGDLAVETDDEHLAGEALQAVSQSVAPR